MKKPILLFLALFATLLSPASSRLSAPSGVALCVLGDVYGYWFARPLPSE